MGFFACSRSPRAVRGRARRLRRGAEEAGAQAATGCFVHLFDGDDFDETDDNFKLTEPGRYGNLEKLPDATKDWDGEPDSLRVGEGATVTIWSEKDFGGDSKTYESGDEEGRLPQEVRSLELTCD